MVGMTVGIRLPRWGLLCALVLILDPNTWPLGLEICNVGNVYHVWISP